MKKFHHLFWDDKNIAHIARHNVTVDEVEQAVFNPRICIRKGRGTDIYYLFSRTEAGRYLFIVLLEIRKYPARVITTRDMSRKEKKWYRS